MWLVAERPDEFSISRRVPERINRRAHRRPRHRPSSNLVDEPATRAIRAPEDPTRPKSSHKRPKVGLGDARLLNATLPRLMAYGRPGTTDRLPENAASSSMMKPRAGFRPSGSGSSSSWRGLPKNVAPTNPVRRLTVQHARELVRSSSTFRRGRSRWGGRNRWSG